MRGFTLILLLLWVVAGVSLGVEAGPTNVVFGRLVGTDGKPVVGALVTAVDVVDTNGVALGWGDFPKRNGIRTDVLGEFTLQRAEAFEKVLIVVNMAGLPRATLWIDSEPGLHTEVMSSGAALRGRVVKEGKPLVDVAVEIANVTGNSGTQQSHQARTDTNGVFLFRQLAPGSSWTLYGLMESLGSFGVLAEQRVYAPVEGRTNDLGDLPVARGWRVAGRIKSRNGEGLPENLKVYLTTLPLQDMQAATATRESGRFEFDGVPAGEVRLVLGAQDWKWSGVNRSLDDATMELAGKLTEDETNLVLEVEKRIITGWEPEHSSDEIEISQGPDGPRNRTLRGVESSGPPDIILAGRLVDDETGEAIKSFRVTPGRKPPTGSKPLMQQLTAPFKGKTETWNDRVRWQDSREETFSNGVFEAHFEVLANAPVLRFDAPGYAPLKSEAMKQSDTNLILRMVKGKGLNGVVLLPDGTLADGAQVGYGAAHDQFLLTRKQLSGLQHAELLRTTEKDGKFAFPSRLDGAVLFVTHKQGWAMEAVASGEEQNLKLQLQPWTTVTGTLVDTNGAPVAGMSMRLSLPANQLREPIYFSLQNVVSTDAQGRFTFFTVPPGRWELQRMVPFGKGFPSGIMKGQLQARVVASPGGTNDLGTVTMDRPGPGPLWEQVKGKLGL